MATHEDQAAKAATAFRNAGEIFTSLSTALKSHTVPHTMMISTRDTPEEVRSHLMTVWGTAVKAAVNGWMDLHDIPEEELPVKHS